MRVVAKSHGRAIADVDVLRVFVVIALEAVDILVQTVGHLHLVSVDIRQIGVLVDIIIVSDEVLVILRLSLI